MILINYLLIGILIVFGMEVWFSTNKDQKLEIEEEDFKFDYYPTQWDLKNVHVFLDEDNQHRNVKLVPKNTFLDQQYTDKEIANNTYNSLKEINTIV